MGGCVTCAALLVVGSEQEKRAQRRHTVSDAQARAVRLGTPRDAVLARLGSPARPYRDARLEAGDDCVFYNERGGEVGTQWQLCFSRGRVVAKYHWAA
jgi:hypothetical protein